jgi:hypothetical protein
LPGVDGAQRKGEVGLLLACDFVLSDVI